MASAGMTVPSIKRRMGNYRKVSGIVDIANAKRSGVRELRRGAIEALESRPLQRSTSLIFLRYSSYRLGLAYSVRRLFGCAFLLDMSYRPIRLYRCRLTLPLKLQRSWPLVGIRSIAGYVRRGFQCLP